MDISGQVACNPLSKEPNHSRYLLIKATELLWGNVVFGVICSSLCVYLEDIPKFREHGCEFHEHQWENSKMSLNAKALLGTLDQPSVQLCSWAVTWTRNHHPRHSQGFRSVFIACTNTTGEITNWESSSTLFCLSVKTDSNSEQLLSDLW